MEAKAALFRASLLDRNTATRSISIHRLVQGAVIDELSQDNKSRFLRLVIDLLTEVFPCAWANSGGDGFTYVAWDWCQRCIPHVTHISRQFSDKVMSAKEATHFIELMFSMRLVDILLPLSHRNLLTKLTTIMNKTESYTDCMNIPSAALSVSLKYSIVKTSYYAAIVNIIGLIEVDPGNPKQTLIHYQEGRQLREADLEKDEWEIGVGSSNLGLAHSELGETELAMYGTQGLWNSASE